jgi:nicotinic acid mononucleotide adenylyltransferase
VIIIPDNNPFKKYDKALDRSPSINQIDQIVDDKNIFLYLGFSELQDSNPTNTWIKKLKAKTNKKLSLLMGFDSFITIHKWLESESLLNNITKIYMLSRQDQIDKKKEQLMLLKDSNPNLEVIFLGNHSYEQLSSSALREITSKE